MITSTNTKVPNTDVLKEGVLLEEDTNNDTEVWIRIAIKVTNGR